MKKLYLFLQNSVGLLMLCLALSNCHRATYSFQPVSTNSPGAEAVSLPITASGSLTTVSVSRSPKYSKRKHKTVVAGKKPVAHPKTKARIIPAARLVRQQQPVIRQQLKNHLRPATHQNDPNPPERFRSRGIAMLLAALGPFIGIFGLHHFYLGYTGRGVAYLLAGLLSAFLIVLGVLYLVFGSGFIGVLAAGLILAGIVTIAQFVDIIAIATGSLKPKNGAYNPGFFQTKRSAETPTPEQK